VTPGVTLDSKCELLQGRVSLRELASGAYRWLRAELVVTETARERLAAWVRSGGLTRSPDLSNPPYCGDGEILPAVTAALGVVPACVAELVMRDTLILASGRSTHGWTAPLTARPRVIVLNGDRPNDAITRTLLHEIAHVWVEPLGDGVTPTAAGRQAYIKYAHEEGFVPLLLDHRKIHESRAINLARIWEQSLETHL